MKAYVVVHCTQFSSVAQSCLTLWEPMNCSTPGLPVHHQLPEFTQTRVQLVSDTIQTSHPSCSLLLPPSVFPSIRVFSDELVLRISWPKYWSFSFKISPTNEHVWMWELDYKESWALKNWWFWTVVLEKTLESPLDCKEIQPVHPKGDQSWLFIGRTVLFGSNINSGWKVKKVWWIGRDYCGWDYMTTKTKTKR